jgi:chemotaxis receptor (MCP) glutamine deamidase CheD
MSIQGDVVVAPDEYQLVTDQRVLTAELHSAIAVCVFDAIEDVGALLHLRFAVHGARPIDATDTTVATELLLLDRCLDAVRSARNARNLHARLVAHLPPGVLIATAGDTMLSLVDHFLKDAGIVVSPPDVASGPARRLRFEPGMGSLRIL